jgi:hypothetical protein
MPNVQKLPEAHTNFILSVQWDGTDWALLLLALAGAAAVVGVLLYLRGRRN